jgi:carnitine-CoA ligase
VTRYFTDLHPTEPDRTKWTVAHALRAQAAARPDRTFLIVPDERREWTFGETLADAERVAGGLRGAGAAAGDRVVVMAANCARFVLTWLGCGLGGLVEVPVNTAYEGEFLRHQVALVGARWAVIDDVHAARFVALRDALPTLEGFWVIDTGHLDEALSTLRDAGWTAQS